LKGVAAESAFHQVKKRMIKGNCEGAYVMVKDEAWENIKEQIFRRLMEKLSRGSWKDGARAVVQ